MKPCDFLPKRKMFVSKLIRSFLKICLGKLSGLKLIKLEPFGSFVFYETEKTWVSLVKNISPTNDLELLIEVNDFNQDLAEKTGLSHKNIIK